MLTGNLTRDVRFYNLHYHYYNTTGFYNLVTPRFLQPRLRAVPPYGRPMSCTALWAPYELYRPMGAL